MNPGALVEVVGLSGAGWVLEALVVDREALEEVVFEAGGCPLAELGAAGGADAEGDGEDDREAVVLDGAGDGPGTLWTNY